MHRVKLTLRLDPDLLAAVANRARRSDRGISNCVEAMLSQLLRLPSPRPDFPNHLDARYTARPRKA